MSSGDGKRIRSVERSVRILERIVNEDEGGVNELARALDYSPSTVHAHLATLHDLGYLVTVDGEYAVSNRFLQFARHAQSRIEGLDVIRANVRRLADETGESAQFMIEEHGRGIYVERAEGERGAPNDTSLGKPRYLHMCASGKAILAHLPRERVTEIVDRWGLPVQTARTITDEETLFAELDAIRDEGVATNDGETVDGLTAVGAPIRSADGRVIGSISVSGPAHRISSNGEIRERYRDELIGAVEDVALNLKYL
ncbi:IclR family transcriptional regulator [Halorubrum depositum]|uniref:IclR family transcriptional regulator n=1 Tax=Halorubrum depositum TaxID=2583992 RepID=UPI0011A664E2|nr:IclR family transcriptional regulator [Halorubrum depositum]